MQPTDDTAVHRMTITPAAVFLDADQVRHLTGRSQPSRQIEQLRAMGVPFFINAGGRPVVACSAVDGVKPPAATKPTSLWQPAVLKRA